MIFTRYLFFLLTKKETTSKKTTSSATSHKKRKMIWYLGGIPGGFTVLLAAITVNSPLSLAGSIILMITGQIIFGLLVDAMGWFGVIKRKITVSDFLMCTLLITGCSLLIIGK
ncbi:MULTISPECIES: DMT family transporter [unclassified Providencia]|uniref:DMT family transporter n=1 Tax=Providencia TaxID=586 RepID=UPI00300E5165